MVLGASMVLLLVAALVWFFPARWALAWMAPRLHGLRLQQVHGLVWHGRADQVLMADGHELGRVQWKLPRRALLAPAPMQVDFDGPQLAFSGSMQAEPNGRVRWDNVQLRADLALWRPHKLPALGRPRGEWQMTVDHALLQDGWPLQLDMRARWHDAVLVTRSGNVALGELDWRVSAHAGVIDARVSDVDDGPLQVSGTLRLSPLGWRLDARLHARRADPALRGWLATLGCEDAGGTVHLQRSGGLAPLPAAAPASHATATSTLHTQQGQP